MNASLIASPSLTINKTATVPGDGDGKIDSPSDDINTGNQTLTGVDGLRPADQRPGLR